MVKQKHSKAGTDKNTSQPGLTKSVGTASNANSYLFSEDTTNAAIITSSKLPESPPNTDSQPTIVGHDGLVISVYNAAGSASAPTDSHYKSSGGGLKAVLPNTAAGNPSQAIESPTTVNDLVLPSIPFQISHNAVPPLVSRPKNHQSGRYMARKSNLPISSGYDGFSTFKEFQSLRSAKRVSLNEQSKILSVPMESLQINASASSFTISSRSISIATIGYSPEYMSRLRSFVYSQETMQGIGYIIYQLSEEELERKKRCINCGKSASKRKTEKKGKEKSPLSREGAESIAGQDHGCREQPKDMEAESHSVQMPQLSTENLHELVHDPPTTISLPSAREPIVRCRFHDGVVKFKKWSCCGNHVSSDPCTGKEFHVSRQYLEGELETAWKFHATPKPVTLSEIRPAVAIDCEMGTAKSGDSELIRLTIIDYFSSAVLVDSLVYPDVEMEHYNTRFSGVTRKEIEIARRKGQCLMGKAQARKALWRFVGPDTIVVGHSAHNDLTALRWIHPVVVDTWQIESAKAKDAKAKAVQETKAAESLNPAAIQIAKTIISNQQPPPKRVKSSGPLSLKTLALERLGREIQIRGNKGHDSLEDAIAARDLAHWNVMNSNDSKAQHTLNSTGSSPSTGILSI